MTERDPSSDDSPSAGTQRWNRGASPTEPNSAQERDVASEAARLSDEAKALLQKRAARAAQQATIQRVSIKRTNDLAEETVAADTPDRIDAGEVVQLRDEADAPISVIDLQSVVDLTDSANGDSDELADAVMMAESKEEPKEFVVTKLGDPLPDLSPPSLPPRPGATRPMTMFSPDDTDSGFGPGLGSDDADLEAFGDDDAAGEADVAAGDATDDTALGRDEGSPESSPESSDAEASEPIQADDDPDELIEADQPDAPAAEPETENNVSEVGEAETQESVSYDVVAPPPPVPQTAQPAELVPLQHAVLPALVENQPAPSRVAPALLIIAAALALLSGILGLMWLLERSETADLREQVAQAEAANSVTDQGLDELNREVQTLRLQNEQLEQERNDLSALVLELPAGRVTEIPVPFTPLFADEENGRLIAIGESGEYITWGEGADGPITDSGTVSGTPTGLFASVRKAWISTDAGRIDVLSLVAGEPGLPSVEFGPTSFMAAEERGYWTYNSATSEVVRLKKSDGSITDAVDVPVPIIDLTIGAGSVWALGDDSRVYRINTADLTVQAIDAGEDLISVTATPDALWTLSAADGSLRRIDPVTGEILVTVPVGRDPIDATFAGQAVWVALRSGSSLIEVDTRTSAVVSRTTLPSEPTALHQGDSGVFVTTNGDVPLVRVASLTVEAELPEDSADSEADDESTEDS